MLLEEKVYNPTKVEPYIYSLWENNNLFHSTPSSKSPYTIVIPPPNVTGILHMGHALNNTIQDILIRFYRMQGYEALWVPGTDHAGIATQNVVERELHKQGLSKEQIGRDAFIQKVWEWKEKYGDIIIKQLKRLGASCDWERSRFTMDKGLSEAVKKAFIHLYKKGLIYKGRYIINWCPRCKTALADDEVEHEEIEGNIWYIKYPLVGNEGFITVATTRPETMLGDTAVAVNPKDNRYKKFIGKKVLLPFVNREIPIIEDEMVEIDFGTGAVKVTPAHDPNDFIMGNRHNLEQINIMNDDGSMNENAGEFKGYDRFECRKLIINRLKEMGLLEKSTPHVHSVGHCYRCKTIIEPRISWQWFVKMRPLAEKAIKASKEGEVKFYPSRWEKFYLGWLENVRDWCISRQIWWGHRIPVWYCENCSNIICAESIPSQCEKCGSSNLKQDEDVLDTWFSSALWPFSTLGWPHKTPELKYYYPTSTLVTDRGIIYFWVARMIMMGLELMGEVPFKNVYIHGTILDEQGRKMSKSLGNGIDPIEMIEKYGADAVRFSLIMLTTEGQDIKLSETKFEMGRNFTNKLWNAARFVFMNLKDFSKIENIDINKLNILHRWILLELESTQKKTTQCLENFKLNEALNTIYDFFWHKFCDWYLEGIKHQLNDNTIKNITQNILVYVFDKIIRLFHPFTPFITEVLWQELNKIVPSRELSTNNPCSPYLIKTEWPISLTSITDETIRDKMKILQGIIRSIRNTRTRLSIPRNNKIELIIDQTSDIKWLDSEIEPLIHILGNVSNIQIKDLENTELPVDVVDTIKIAVKTDKITQENKIYKERLLKQKKEIQQIIIKIEKQLNNSKFLEKAPPHVIEREKKRLLEFKEKLKVIEESLNINK